MGYSLMSSTTCGSHSLYWSSSACSCARSSLRAFSSFSRELLSFCRHTHKPCFTFDLSPHTLPAVGAHFERTITVSWRPTFAFSTTFWRVAFRCLASESWKTEQFSCRRIQIPENIRKKEFLHFKKHSSMITLNTLTQ